MGHKALRASLLQVPSGHWYDRKGNLLSRANGPKTL